MKLVLAEKPSVAQSIARVLGANNRCDGYLEGNGYVVSWCVGHLVELFEPEGYDEKYSKWNYDDLPIVPDEWKYQVSAGTRKQFGILRQLMKRDDVESLVCATDAGREGELIFRLVYYQCRCKKPFERLWISSMEDSAIREGFANLKPSTEYDALYEAALSRERADWIVGINATRLFSVLYGQTLNVGRVMTPRGGTVKTILTRMEYTGCTVNFRTKKESYKDKRPTKVDSSEWIIFEDTQEPIIDKHTWETVQKLLDTPRRKGVFEENNPLTGKVFCADCGAKMYHHRNAQGIWKKNYFKAGEMIYHAPEDRYDCSNNIRGRQRYEKLCCSHSITTKALETLVLETIKRTCDYAVENEAEFRETVCSISEEQQGELSVRLEKRLAKKQKRVNEVNRLIKKLYEDNISGKLNDKRFNAMLSDYESELEALEEDIDRDNAELEGMSAKKTDVDVFMELVKKHTTFEELTPAILNEFVDKIMVYKAVGSGANRTQDVDIYLNYIGRFVVPEVVVELTEEEKLAEAKRQEKLEKKRASNRKYMARKREEARKAWAEIEAEKAKAVGQ